MDPRLAPVSYTHLDVYKRQVNNKTKCGSGSCSLNFDNDSSSKILEVNQGTYQVPITVRFQDANPVAGGFDGSAVLSVDIL